MKSIEIQQACDVLLSELQKLQSKHDLAEHMSADFYEPGMMENPEQYQGTYDENTGRILVRTNAKGLRYDNRSAALDTLSPGEPVRVVRDPGNPFNANNFRYFTGQDTDLGNMDAALCNAIAPLYDEGFLQIKESRISYIERLSDRSRYAKQGVLFVELHLQLYSNK